MGLAIMVSGMGWRLPLAAHLARRTRHEHRTNAPFDVRISARATILRAIA